MSPSEPNSVELDLEITNQRLTRRLQELEEILGAIQEQRVDALIVEGPQGKRVFTLEGAERPYRMLVEEMHQGALTLDESGMILYCNRRFARMVGVPQEKLLASQIEQWAAPGDRSLVSTLVRQARTRPVRGELLLATAAGSELPVYLSLERLSVEAGGVLAVLVTDLSEQHAHRELVASEELARSIVDQAVDAMVVCDPHGAIVRCNQAARDLSLGAPLRERFDRAFPLSSAAAERARVAFAAVLAGKRRQEVDVDFVRSDGRRIDAALKVGPLTGGRGQVIGAVATVSDISERVRSERERAWLLESERTARAEAERANRLKDEFVATLSHELRTPLNAILGWVQLLRASSQLEGEVARGMEVIERNARLQGQLIADLLDISRMLSGGLRLDQRTLDLRQVVVSAIESVQPTAQGKQLGIESSFADGEFLVSGDPARLEQVVWNLLTNAVKFTSPLGHIRVALQREGTWVELVVSDNGQGIRADFLPHVFDRFRQADAGITRASAGLGLGLAIVKQLVELHAGKVSAFSDGEGLGARFVIRLPSAVVESARDEAGDPPPSTAVQPLESASLEGVGVLLVEDEADARELARTYLSERGARVKSAASVDEALQMLRWFQPDVVVSDIGLPGRDGYELVRELRRSSTPSHAELRAIALTAFAQREDEERALGSGYQAHLAKPIDLARLAATIRSVLDDSGVRSASSDGQHAGQASNLQSTD
jgi:PAS domain S-box-containing protein